MKRWRSAAFPLILLSTLAALTFWLRHLTETSGTHNDGRYRHDPDYIVKEGVLRKISPTGELLYTLKTPEARHYPDDNTVALTMPSLVYFRPNAPIVTIDSDWGVMQDDGEAVDLQGHVQIVREATQADPKMVATTPQLTLLPEEEKAFTRSPVLIVQGNSWVKGTGMRVDNRAQTYALESNASALIEQKKK